MADTSDVFHFEYTGGDEVVYGVYMENVRIEGHSSNKPRAGIYMERPIVSTLKHVEIDSCEYGLYVEPAGNSGGTTLNLENCYFIYNTNGAKIRGITAGNILGGAFEGSDSTGLILERCFNWNVIGVDFEKNTDHDVELDSTSSTIFIGNRFMSNPNLPKVHVKGTGWASRISFITNNFSASPSDTTELLIENVTRVLLLNNHFSASDDYILTGVTRKLIFNDYTLTGDIIKASHYFCGLERSSDPPEPSEGEYVIWMSNGAGYGDDGDICIASKAGGVTKKAILFDHSAGTAW